MGGGGEMGGGGGCYGAAMKGGEGGHSGGYDQLYPRFLHLGPLKVRTLWLRWLRSLMKL